MTTRRHDGRYWDADLQYPTTAFTRQAVRPRNLPPVLDPKTGELVDYLFRCDDRRTLSLCYINTILIPLLCRKAGVPESDTRGPITSHRARSTIASHLYKAKDSMTLFDVQAWLGHSTLRSCHGREAYPPSIDT